MGCATIARKLCRAINFAPNSIIRAIASRSIEKAEAFAAENGLWVEGDKTQVRVYGSYIELLNDPFVDAIYLPLPSSLHLEWAVLAASKKKHLLLEKPTALDSSQLELILKACEANGVQFMDGSMWCHHPRTAKMKECLSDSTHFGHVHWVNCTSSFLANPEFMETNIRVKPECDALGALGDLGWYCIGAILWALNYQLPNYVTALPGVTLNSEGIILACSASLHWEKDPKTVASFYCSFLSHVSMDLIACGSHGSLRLDDRAIPCRENSASFILSTTMGWNMASEQVRVESRLPQEALMVQQFAKLVKSNKSLGGSPDKMWPEISRKILLVLDGVRRSIDEGLEPVFVIKCPTPRETICSIGSKCWK